MKAFVYYIELTERQRNEINQVGWNSPIGRYYHNVRNGTTFAAALPLLRLAAVVEADNAEQVWATLQNGQHTGGWASPSEHRVLKAVTDFTRSMDVGDFIVWENDRIEQCASFGFAQREPGSSDGPNPWLQMLQQ